MPPSRFTNSCITTVSANMGNIAPVKIRAHSPGRTGTSECCPAATSITTFHSLRPSKAKAYPSTALHGKSGWSTGETRLSYER